MYKSPFVPYTRIFLLTDLEGKKHFARKQTLFGCLRLGRWDASSPGSLPSQRQQQRNLCYPTLHLTMSPSSLALYFGLHFLFLFLCRTQLYSKMRCYHFICLTGNSNVSSTLEGKVWVNLKAKQLWWAGWCRRHRAGVFLPLSYSYIA